MKHITIKRRKNFCYDAYTFTISKSVRTLIDNCCFLTRMNIHPWIRERVKEELNCKYVSADWKNWDHELESKEVEKYNHFNKMLRKNNPDLMEKIDQIEEYWRNNGIIEYDYKKYRDTFGHLIRMKKYDDVIDAVKDMNNQFINVLIECGVEF